jgi:hypothetical protein
MPFVKRAFAKRALVMGLFLSLPLLPYPGNLGRAHAEFPSSHPYLPIRYEHRVGTNPARNIFIARVDLTYPSVDVRVSKGGPDPDGEGEWQSTLQAPSVIAEREHFDLAVNADFFTARSVKDAEGTKSGFVTGIWSKVLGPAVTDGYTWGPASSERATLSFDRLNRPTIALMKDVPEGAYQVVAGSHIILKDGKTVVEGESSFSTTQHPRTAAGIADNGKTLVLVVIDGRRAQSAVGMGLIEMADLMRGLGCTDALNLDGGGSSEMVLRNPQTGQLHVMNKPSDGRERAVGNVLGISIRGSRRTPTVVPIPITPYPTPAPTETTVPATGTSPR